MGSIFGKEERENLESLKQDLVGPIRSFVSEVREDTVGDAGRFYASRAKKAAQSTKLAQEKARAQMAALRQEQERMQRRRKAAMKRAAITLALIALFALVIISAALSAHADAPEKPAAPCRTQTQENLPAQTGRFLLC